MKKLVAALLAASLSLFILGGCAFSPTDNSDDSGKNPTIPTDTKENVTVVINKVEKSEVVEAPEPTDLKSVLKKVLKSVVKVEYVTAKKEELFASGVVIARGVGENSGKVVSYVVTSLNFIEECSKKDAESAEGGSEKTDNPVKIIATDGKTYDGTFIGGDPDGDACVVSIEADLPSVDVYDGVLETGEKVYVGGNPLNAVGGAVTSGIISAVCEDFQLNESSVNFLLTDAVVKDGSIGGGVFTASGLFSGMLTKRLNEKLGNSTDGLGVAIPSDVISYIAENLIGTYKKDETLGYIPNKYVLGYTTGWNYGDNPWATRGFAYFDYLDETGSLYKGGLRVGDKIKSIRLSTDKTAKLITKSTDFKTYIQAFNLKIGDRIVVGVTRDQTAMEFYIKIEQYVYGALDSIESKTGL